MNRSRFCLIVPLTALIFGLVACSDDEVGANAQTGDCAPDEQWNPIEEACTPSGEEPDPANNQPSNQPNNSSNNQSPGNSGDPTNNQTTPPPINNDDDGPCQGLECDQVACDEGSTVVTGKVHIPSGELPLPDVAVYVPNSEPEPHSDGATCVPCTDQFSADPVVGAFTNVHGVFTIDNVPVGQDIPLVIEVGKWRRTLTIDNVPECETTELDEEDTRLPRNQDEGDLPQIAITTGEWDAIECLIPKIGVDFDEISTTTLDDTNSEDSSVHLFSGMGGANRFEASLNNGASFPDASSWWNELDNLLDYDIVIHSCEGQATLNNKSQEARDALLDFTHSGGRAFLSHLHYVWLRDGPAEFQAVADWEESITGGNETGWIETSFDKGQMLREWMYHTGTTPAGEFPISETRGSIGSLDLNYAQPWVWIEPEEPPIPLPGFPGIPEPSDEDLVQYFSFNTPLNASPSNQCGRVVFSDIHVGAGQDSTPDHPYPSGCNLGEITPQEKALIFMLFDLARCIVPDKEDDI